MLFLCKTEPLVIGHETTEELYDFDNTETDHPPISPDLNPQENLWNWLKDYVSQQYSLFDIRPYYPIPIIQEGWELYQLMY